MRHLRPFALVIIAINAYFFISFFLGIDDSVTDEELDLRFMFTFFVLAIINVSLYVLYRITGGTKRDCPACGVGVKKGITVCDSCNYDFILGELGEPQEKLSKKRKAFSVKDYFTLSAFVGIPTAFHILLVWVPSIATIGLSFTYWSGIKVSDIKWAGLANYNNILTGTPVFWEAIWHNVVWLLWFGLIATPIGILLAYQIDRQIKGHRFYESAFFVPVVLSLAVTGIIWNFMLQPGGFVQGIMGRDIANPVSIYGNYDINTYVIMGIASWRHIGYIMLLYLSGLKSVDASLKEASAIDGATEWQTFRKVILPTMKPVNIIIIVITVIDSLRAFDIVYMIYGSSTGWPILGVLVFQNMSGGGMSMKGAAYAVILFALCIVPMITYLKQSFSEDVK
jgi:multiple sugar transport system permease protein/raffinose/stachyose/melibiose transport system permease protein